MLREPHNARLLLFSASKELVAFGGGASSVRSEDMILLLRQLLTQSQLKGSVISYTMADFKRDLLRKELQGMTPEERREFLRSLLASLPADVVREVRERATAGQPDKPSKPGKKKNSGG